MSADEIRDVDSLDPRERMRKWMTRLGLNPIVFDAALRAERRETHGQNASPESPALDVLKVTAALNAAWIDSNDAVGRALPPDLAAHLLARLEQDR